MILLTRQRYKEDITDFLPLGSKYGQALKVYQEISGASRIVAIVSHADTCRQKSPDVLCAAVDAFAALVAEHDTTGVAETMITQIDVEQMEQTAQFLYTNMPYFLTDSDYARMDSLMAQPGYIASQLSADKQMLLFPMAGMMAQNVGRDPLNFFTPVAATLQQRQAAVNYENYDGYIFTPDMSRAIVLMQSPYGSSETSKNAELLKSLETLQTLPRPLPVGRGVGTSSAENDSYPSAENHKGSGNYSPPSKGGAGGGSEGSGGSLACCSPSIHFTGGPVIAVGNAEQIKHDSILAVSLALLLIVGLLFTVFRRVRSLLLIVLSIAWGWLFAMGVLALVHDSVSIIIIGISSVIVGIAVNYPLHLIAHLRHTPSVRQALREIATPLIVGNVTTVGAFLALVPLESVALRDLGIFSSLLLVGTILFVLIFLPQMLSHKTLPRPLPVGRGVYTSSAENSTHSSADNHKGSGNYSPPSQGGVGGGSGGSYRAVAFFIFLLTLVLGYFSLDTTFDANIANINFMAPQQRQDMEYLSTLTNQSAMLGSFPAPGSSPAPGSFAPGSSSALGSSPGSVSSANCAARPLYVVSTDTSFDAALSRSAALQPLLEQLKREGKVASISSCHQFLCSREEQEHRLALWHDFVSRHGRQIETGIREAARAEGFADGTFDGFLALFQGDLEPQPLEFFAPLTSTVFANSLAVTDAEAPSGSPSRAAYSLVTTLLADSLLAVSDVEQAMGSYPCPLAGSAPGGFSAGEIEATGGLSYAFDVQGMNSAIATRLSDDFNYIGWACGAIVFLFLWFSLGSIEMALLSFLPMAVSWVWILGLMSLLGIQFNVVNIILATFIFGQGDDYTIFMTEGCQYEYAYRRPMLASYRQGIILSALIMFIGIGTLIFARHPALRSLAEVTIVGMSSVVLMAWLLPPFIFRWLVANGSGYRRRPLSLSLLWHRLRSAVVAHASERDASADLRRFVYDRYRYKGLAITTAVARSLRSPSPCAATPLQPSATTSPQPSAIAVIDCGYGEQPLLLALQHPEATVIALDADPDKLTVARHSADQIAPNLTFLEKTGPEQITRLQAEYPSLQVITLNS